MRIISGKYGRRRFDVPRNITARPTTDFARENLFNVLSGIMDFDGIQALDLFAGTGAVTFELLSRGAGRVVSVERAPVQGRFIADVASKLGEENLELLRADALRYIRNCTRGFDLVFADPPYDMEGFGDIPGMILGNRSILRPGGVFVMEHSSRYDFSTLPHFAEKRVYGSVNFSIFRIPQNDTEQYD